MLSKMKGQQKGIALIEALIALLIFSMGLIALVGMQAAMISNTTGSKYRADASYLVQQRLGEIWADPKNLASKTEDISSLLPSGTRTTTVTNTANKQVRVVVTWQEPGDANMHTESAEARVSVN